MEIRSMTGYGKTELTAGGNRIIIEVRSLNSKQLDINMKIPPLYRVLEIDLPKIAASTVIRGKLDITVSVESTDSSLNLLNAQAFKSYFESVNAIVKELGIDVNQKELVSAILHLPDIITPNNNELSDEDKEAFLTCYTDALKELDVCRINEGKIMMNDILLHISNIETKLQTVEIHETARIDKIRASINSALTNIEINTEIDRNRFEQELIYYLEKLDITEEKIRLKQHCVFFRQTSTEEVPGRKLVFISQEIGREINTIGSKACDANIQRIVVEMKDELEKIKEQLCNIL